MLRRFLKSVSSKRPFWKRTAPRRATRQTTCQQAEFLEARVLLAGDVLWTGAAGTTTFGDTANWAEMRVPLADDTAVFKPSGWNDVADVWTTRTVAGLRAQENADFHVNIAANKTLTTGNLTVGLKPAGFEGTPNAKLQIAGGVFPFESGTLVVTGDVNVGSQDETAHGELTLSYLTATINNLYVSKTASSADSGNGTLTLEQATELQVTGEAVVGRGFGVGTGTLFISGDSSLTATSALQVAREGSGAVYVTNGDVTAGGLSVGFLTSASAVPAIGTVNIGEGSNLVAAYTDVATGSADGVWQVIGTLRIDNGAFATLGALSAGIQWGVLAGYETTGYVFVEHEGTEATANSVVLGTGGRGELNVGYGAHFISYGDVVLGKQGGAAGGLDAIGTGAVLVQGAGAGGGRAHMEAADIYVGGGGSAAGGAIGGVASLEYGEGLLTVGADGLVEAGRLFVGLTGLREGETTGGTVTVGGNNAELHAQYTWVVRGDLNVLESGQLHTAGAEIGTSAENVAAGVLVSGPGSTWNANGQVNFGRGGATNGWAVVEVSNGGRIQAIWINKNDAEFKGDGVFNGTTEIKSTTKKARVKPGTAGDATAMLTFETPFWDATEGVTYFTELAGTGAGDYDVLYVTGNVELGGAVAGQPELGGVLDVSLLGYTPQLGDEFDVVVVDGDLNGEFAGYSLPPLPLGPNGEPLTWDVQYDRTDDDLDGHNEVRLVVVQYGTPIAGADAYSVLHNQTLDTAAVPLPGVLDNDYDPNGDPLTAVLVEGPANGALTSFNGATGHFVYQPATDFVGTDYFTYYASDGTNDSYVTVVTIDVTNTAPIAGDDSYFIDHDTQLVEPAPGVLANDTDDDGDPITAVLLDDVDNGVLSLAADGSFTYTPNASFVGFDYFTYAADDGYEQTLATVTIEVFNDVPIAADDIYIMPMDTSLNEPVPGVLGNDFDMDPLTANLVSGPANGSLTLYSSGGFDYVPNLGFTGFDAFSYYASDGLADSPPATVTIQVDDMPGGGGTLVAVDDFYNTPLDVALNEAAPGVMGNDTIGGNTSAVLFDGAIYGTVTLNADGSFLYAPNTGFTGIDTFTYFLEDLTETSTIATVDIQVGNGEPLLAAGPGGSGTFDRLRRAQLVAIVDQAISQWDRLIADPAVRREMRGMEFKIVDLPGNTLAITFPTMIVIDVDAAGYGWFIDATPGTNGEFRFNRATGQYEAAAGPAADRMDLLTVVLHELGHVIGFEDETPRTTHPGDVMLGTLDVGIRRLPDASHTFRFLEDRFEAVIAALPQQRPTDPVLLRQFRRELDSLMSQIGRQREAVRAARPAVEASALDSYFATLDDRREWLLWG